GGVRVDQVDLQEVMTLTEAARKWRLADGATIRKAIERERFGKHELKRSGRTWLVTYKAMERVFGRVEKTPQDFT
ncbi:hypothetical protein ADUPG1_004825, partial [Aduncisulcus paluster]